MTMKQLLFFLLMACSLSVSAQPKSWTADNGNGTFTNPLFYDEFSESCAWVMTTILPVLRCIRCQV